MNRLLALICLLQLFCLLQAHEGRGHHRHHHRDRKIYDTDCSEAAFKEFQKDFGKKSDKHDSTRRQRLCDRIKRFQEHNKKKNVHFEVEVNRFTDMSDEEVKQYQGVDESLRHDRSRRYVDQEEVCENDQLVVPESLDWRDFGIGSNVKYQGNCGSCWAFAAVASLEGIAQKKFGVDQTKITLLSEQQLVDCSTKALNFSNSGCKGGWPEYAFDYIMAAPGLAKTETYPYTKTDGTCSYSPSMGAQKVLQSIRIPEGREDLMKITVATVGPITVALDASRTFQSYSSGIYDDPECKKDSFNHAVTIVGYGTNATAGGDYWIVKNSWAATWGDGGYINIARGKNMCGIATWAAYPGI